MSQRQKQNLNVTIEPPSQRSNGKVDEWRQTIQVYDKLVEAGYEPSDINQGVIILNLHSFSSLVQDYGGKACVKETRAYRLNAVWIDDIEICYTEIKNGNKEWGLIHSWSTLETE